MFCAHCGAENPEDAKSCRSCGQATTATVAEALAARGPQEATLSQPTYSPFVGRLLLGLFALAAAAFDSCQLTVQHAARARLLRPVLISVCALVFLLLAKKAWIVIRSQRPYSGQDLKPIHRRIGIYATAIGTILLLSGVLFGWLIGTSRRQLQILDKDLEDYARIAAGISTARNTTGATISDYVRVCESIEPDVIEMDQVLLRLIPALKEYDTDFPEFHDQTQKSIKNVSATQQRMILLKKEVAVAKKLQGVDASEQLSVWVAEMKPLLEQEEQLDARRAVP